jgi:required for meiotic nuclear division protein 1
MHPIAKAGKTEFRARALLIGERIDLRSLAAAERLAVDPVVVTAGGTGLAVLFRYGAAVPFNVSPLEEGELHRLLAPLVQQPYATPEIETLNIRIDPQSREGMEGNVLFLADLGRLAGCTALSSSACRENG